MVDHPSFLLGSAIVNPGRCVICVGQEEKHVEPQVMGVLMRLVAAPGAVISRDELLQSAWPDTIVNDGALSKAISMLRKVLGDNARYPAYIETIPKVGYRIVAEVHPVEPLSLHPLSIHTQPMDAVERKRIRVAALRPSFFSAKLSELTVGHAMVLAVFVFVLFIFMPRPRVIELEEEITFIAEDGTEVVHVDTLIQQQLPKHRLNLHRMLPIVSQDTVMIKSVHTE